MDCDQFKTIGDLYEENGVEIPYREQSHTEYLPSKLYVNQL